MHSSEARPRGGLFIDDGTLLLSNFNGSVTFNTKKYNLIGSFVVQFSNETSTVGNQNYTSYSTTHLMAMPAVLARVTATDYATTFWHYLQMHTSTYCPLAVKAYIASQVQDSITFGGYVYLKRFRFFEVMSKSRRDGEILTRFGFCVSICRIPRS